MTEQAQQLSTVQVGVLPMGQGLMPEEFAAFKAKGREWSRLYKDRRRKDLLSQEQIEEKKAKNRLRQKRFRERQKTREQQEEALRLSGSIHGDQQQQLTYEQNSQIQYSPAPEDEVKANNAEGTPAAERHQESLVEKRKRLGRERQARFREKRRGKPYGLMDNSQSHNSIAQREIMTLSELQKMSAQLSGYYTGLTQGLSQEEHQTVMRFFLDSIRDLDLQGPTLLLLKAQVQAGHGGKVASHMQELGDDVFGGPTYVLTESQAAQYMVAGQHGGLDLQAIQEAAGHIQNAVNGPHLQPHMGHTHDGQMAAQEVAQQVGELTQAQLEAYHRQLAEHQAHHAAISPPDHRHRDEAQEARAEERHGRPADANVRQDPSGQQAVIFSQSRDAAQELMPSEQPGLQYAAQQQ